MSEIENLELAHCRAVCDELRGKLEAVSAQNAELVAKNEALIDRVEKFNQKNFELTCFSVDVLCCLKTIAFEHNWPDVARYQRIAKDCMDSIQKNNQLHQVRSDAAADALNAEADLMLAAPADAKAAGNIWSESDQKIVLRIGSMLKSRAALLRAKGDE